MARASLAALLVCCCLAAPAARADEVRVYRPQHRLPAELEELVTGVLGSEGSAVADPRTGKLVLKGPGPLLDQAIAVLASLDVPLRSFTVESRVVRAGELADLGLRADGWIRYGDLRVGRGSPRSEGVRLRASDERSRLRSSFASQVAVRDGGSADIWTGTVAPETVAVLETPGRPDRLVVQPERVVRSGMRVEPRGLPDGTVELSIRQIVARDRLEAPIEETGARTQLRVQPGEWLVLGRVGADVHEARDGLGLHDRGAASDDQLVLVRVSEESRRGDSGPRP